MKVDDEEVTSEEDVDPIRERVDRVLREAPYGDGYLTKERGDRNLVDSLLNVDQELHENETLLDSLTSAAVESLTPWALTVPNPKLIPHVPKKKHAKSADNSSLSYHPVLNTEIRHRERVRKSHESDIRVSSQYNQCVEPTTYRYVPNNGKYRHNKSSSHTNSPSMNVRRMKCLDKYISPEQRVVQREVQRSIRKEQLQNEQGKQQDESKDTREIHQQEENPASSSIPSESFDPPSPVAESREFTKHDIVSDNVKETERKTIQPTIHEAVELPAMDIPLVGKQISDKFMEKFSRRINALDEEMKRDLRMLRRSPEDSLRSRSEPSRILSQHMSDSREAPKEVSSDVKSLLAKYKRPEPITEGQITQSFSSTSEHLETISDANSEKDVSPRKGALFYKVRNRFNDKRIDSGLSNSEHYDREVTPRSDSGGTPSQRYHGQPRRTMSFDQNMIQRAKIHRDHRLSGQSRSQYLRRVPPPPACSGTCASP